MINYNKLSLLLYFLGAYSYGQNFELVDVGTFTKEGAIVFCGNCHKATWSGGIEDSYANGRGVLIVYDKENNIEYSYSGSLNLGRTNGYGVYESRHIGKYEGNWKDGKRHGFGKFMYISGERYEGNWKDNNMDGKGIFYFENKDIYEGNWKDNNMDGKGIFYFENKDIYEGNWKDNNMDGEGIYYFGNGIKYVGKFVKQNFNGKKYSEKGILLSEGEWEEDIMLNGNIYDIKGKILKIIKDKIEIDKTQLTYDEIYNIIKTSKNRSYLEDNTYADIMISKIDKWNQYEDFLLLFPKYGTMLDTKGYKDLSNRAISKNWCSYCCEVYLKLFNKNSERRTNVIEWRRVAYNFELSQQNIESQKKLIEDERRKEVERNKTPFQLGERICTTITNFGFFQTSKYSLCGTVENFSADRQSVQIKVIGWDNDDRNIEYRGEVIRNGNYIWVNTTDFH